jgi:hypothetical protein
MPVTPGNRKACSACGIDLTFAKRVRNPAGGFLCEPCAPAAEAPPAKTPGHAASKSSGVDPVPSPVHDEDDGYQLKEDLPAPRPQRAGPRPTPATVAASAIPRFPPAGAVSAAIGRPRGNRPLWIGLTAAAAVLTVGGTVVFLLSGSHRSAPRGQTGVSASGSAEGSPRPALAGHDDQRAKTQQPLSVASPLVPSLGGRVLGTWHVDDRWDITLSRQGGGFKLHEDWQGQGKDSSQWRPVDGGLAFSWDKKDVFVVRPGPGDQLTVEQYPNACRDFFNRHRPLPARPGNTKVAVRAG